jgi:hypothetical protein
MTEAGGRVEEARKAIACLVERYARNRDRYRASTYNEETCRAEFITPLFEAFGWDVTNKAGYAEQYKDVIHEEGIKVGDYTKAPDYTFRIAGVRKFFVEAKKPFVDLKSDPAPAYQLRRYAWSAKLPLSVLTDFEEIAVYDTRIRPKEGDKPSVGRILYITYEEILPRLDELWAIFSKGAVLKGSFDRYAEDTKGKRGTSEVDAEFLREIEGWRDELARNIAIRNEDLSVDDLNFAVQTTIDRIIFLRIAEGRGAEPYGSLLGLVNGVDIYKRLVAVYRKADTRYNSGLFDFQADRLTPGLAVDDKVLKPILLDLYYPQSPYEFSVLPAEILGNVYEQFLGKVIRLTKGHHAVVEEKPEVKKAGGVYYTPAYIVDYIVKQTVGELCDGKSPKQMEKLRILDPACGSGSFLLRAYQELLDRHLAWYREHEPPKRQKAVFLGPGGDWRLTAAEKHRVVLNNIFGVDIDRQAVEVTKLSLLLKVLEGENEESIRQQNLFGERALPSLERNIKCGNSLVSSDLLGDKLFEDDEPMSRARPFDWSAEFPRVFAARGFDVVLGNPPYSYRNATEEALRPYYDAHYASTQGNYDLYKFFLERSLQLVAPKGFVGMIVSASFLVQPSFSRLRELLLNESIELLAPLGPGAFAKATVDTAILVIRRVEPREGIGLLVVTPGRPPLLPKTNGYRVTQSRFRRNLGSAIDYRLTDEAAALVDRLHRDFPRIESGFDFGVGINTGFIRDELVSDKKVDSRYHAMVPGSGIARYGAVQTTGWIMYDPDYIKRRGKLGRSLPPREYFDQAKILVVRTRNLSLPGRIVATIDRGANYNLNRLSNIIARPSYNLIGLLGVLNSSLFNWLFSTRYFDYEIKPVYLRACPMPDVNDAKLVRAVTAIMATQVSVDSARSPTVREGLIRKMTLLEESVDEIVERLFGLKNPERGYLDLYRVGGRRASEEQNLEVIDPDDEGE